MHARGNTKGIESYMKNGMADFQSAIDLHALDSEMTWLSAYKNLKIAEEEINFFEGHNESDSFVMFPV
ncbi:hypothetical protein DN068_19690 [Taibaiella soli]|uniref:Uncharacterized protein n=1 Tax=Taibaiella soli TaxID=1649169 RepID=A0A2W2AU07_9BACT|nr:hypothetical protein DN068_19690 [Taibaiella soli]